MRTTAASTRSTSRQAFALLLGAVLTTSPLSAQTGAPVRTGNPPAAAAPGSATPAANAPTAQASTMPKPRESWTADRRNSAVGDIVTVLIDDYTISTAVKENIASDARTRVLDASAQLPAAR